MSNLKWVRARNKKNDTKYMYVYRVYIQMFIIKRKWSTGIYFMDEKFA